MYLNNVGHDREKITRTSSRKKKYHDEAVRWFEGRDWLLKWAVDKQLPNKGHMYLIVVLELAAKVCWNEIELCLSISSSLAVLA